MLLRGQGLPSSTGKQYNLHLTPGAVTNPVTTSVESASGDRPLLCNGRVGQGNVLHGLKAMEPG